MRAVVFVWTVWSLAGGAIACEQCQRRAREQTLAGSHERSGCPHQVADRRAMPTYTDAYAPGYIGGGVLRRGRGPTVDEGVWGRDYVGNVYARRVFLLWSGGTQYYGGKGRYETDGPKLLHH